MKRLDAPARSCLAWLLVIAIVYQAGACPCGCWDESVWGTSVERIVEVLTMRLGSGRLSPRPGALDGGRIAQPGGGPGDRRVAETDRALPTRGVAIAAGDPHECQGSPVVTDRSGARSNSLQLAHDAAIQVPSTAPLWLVWQSSLLRLDTGQQRPSAAVPRAQLQVFLL